MFEKIRKKIKKNLSVEIARAKRFDYSIAVILFEIIEGVDRSVKDKLPGTTVDVDYLRGQFRPYDTVENTDFQRYTILLPQAKAIQSTESVIERLKKIASENNWGEVNIGVALFPRDGDDPVELLRLAEERLEESISKE